MNSKIESALKKLKGVKLALVEEELEAELEGEMYEDDFEDIFPCLTEFQLSQLLLTMKK